MCCGTGPTRHCPWAHGEGHRVGAALGKGPLHGGSCAWGSLSEPGPSCFAPRVPPPGAGVPAGAGLPASSLQRQALWPGRPPWAPQHPGRTTQHVRGTVCASHVDGACVMFAWHVAHTTCVHCYEWCVHGVCRVCMGGCVMLAWHVAHAWHVCAVCMACAWQMQCRYGVGMAHM